MKSTNFLTLIFPMLLSLVSFGQSPATLEAKPCHSLDNELRKVTAATPAVYESAIRKDLSTIENAQKRVREVYAQSGIDNCGAEAVTALAWKDIRLNHPDGELDGNALFKQATEDFGGIHIVSIPPGALIKIDGIPWVTPTNTDSWTHPGKRKITLSLKGYRDSEGETEVVVRKVVQYRKALKKAK